MSVSTNAPDTNITPSTTASPDRTSRSLRESRLLSVARSISGSPPRRARRAASSCRAPPPAVGSGSSSTICAVGEEDDPVGVRGGVRVVGDHDDGLAELARRESRRKPSTSAPERESRLPVGSSAKMTSGRETSARAHATRCCWPPESWAGRWPSRSRRPTVSMTVSNHAWSGLRPAIASGSRMFSSAVSVGSRLNCWKMKPTLSRRSLVRPRVAQAGHLGVADAHLAAGDRVQAGQAVHQRRLAGAGRAHDRGEPAALELDAHPAQRDDLRLAGAVDLPHVRRAGGDRRVAVRPVELAGAAHASDRTEWSCPRAHPSGRHATVVRPQTDRQRISACEERRPALAVAREYVTSRAGPGPIS